MQGKIEYPPVGVKDVAKAMWEGLRPNGWLTLWTLFLYLASSLASVYTPVLYKNFFDTLSSATDRALGAHILITLVVWILILHALAWGTRTIANFGIQRIEPETMARLRNISFEHLVRHSFGFFTNTFTGSLIQRVNRFARAFERMADTVAFNLIPLSVTTVGAIFITWTITPLLSLIILIWTGVFFGLNYIFAIWRVKYNIQIAAADSKTTGALADILTNQNSVALFTAFPYEKEYFSEVTNEQSRVTIRTWNVNSAFDAVQSAITFIAEFIIFYNGILLWERGAMTLGTFVLVQVYIIQLASQLWDFGRIIRTVYEVYADSKEMVEILALPHEIQDVPLARELSISKGDIAYDEVTFSFQESRKVLDGITLAIPGGQKVALVGPSGAGKTTFVRLLLRFYDLTSGRILIDGQDIAEATQESLRRNIALVPQEPILFHRSLLNNIRYGRLDATDEEVKKAASLAHCDEFIESLPLGYETFVGERGVKLSGGERQRIAIARAILKNAPILILDEATSSLDSHSEALIQDALDTLMKGKTAIVVAHRLSTIRKMDRIIVLEGGKVREDGTHEKLLRNENSLYRSLWNLQAGGFIVDTDA
ncbi:MAG: ABC transporter ATP-binding protein [Patescibacteria group bacterium]|nr:ABC transporter ATP-binding protein [Patescibacteria group bacterium]